VRARWLDSEYAAQHALDVLWTCRGSSQEAEDGLSDLPFGCSPEVAMKSSPPRRNWDQALEKVMLAGGRCRVCDSRDMVQCAHIIGRENDCYQPMRDEGDWREWTVYPDRIVPLCKRCHEDYDTHKLDLLPYLHEHEVHQAIADCARSGRSNGFWEAGRRICGNRTLQWIQEFAA
jgi:hypothetical protein